MMKPIHCLLLVFASSAIAADPLPVIKDKAQLEKHHDQRVVLEGVYHDPGKGDRIVDCGFAIIRIEDYSFYTKTKEGTLATELNNGERIRFSAKLRFQEGRKVRVSRMRKDIQMALPPIQTIKGKEYYVWPPSYSIREAVLLNDQEQNR